MLLLRLVLHRWHLDLLIVRPPRRLAAVVADTVAVAAAADTARKQRYAVAAVAVSEATAVAATHAIGLARTDDGAVVLPPYGVADTHFPFTAALAFLVLVCAGLTSFAGLL